MDEIEYKEIKEKFLDLLGALKDAKPEDRNELSRRFAVTITELEKAYAYFVALVCTH